MGLAFAGKVYVICTAFFLIFGFIFVVSVNSLRKYPRFLPKFLHSWNCLPTWFRSLEPYDRVFSKCICCERLFKLTTGEKQDEHETKETVLYPVVNEVTIQVQQPTADPPIST